MRLYEIPEQTKLEFKFKFKEKDFCMDVNLQMKRDETIYIQAICCDGEPIEKMQFNDAILTYKAEIGIYTFVNLKIQLVLYLGVYLYAVTSELNVERMNRRENFRVFIGDSVSVRATNTDGKLCEYPAVLKDISTTGMGVILSHKIENLSYMEILISITEKSKLHLIGDVVNNAELPNNRGFLYGCKLRGHSEVLSRYIIKRQVQNKQNKQKKPINKQKQLL